MTTNLIAPNSVRAGVSERKLFASLSQWFASSFSVLGELMQNARRAEATEIHFSLSGKDLTIQDNGIGVADFQNLVQFAESGWKVETQIAENPFGMGFFSCLYSAEAVTVQSRGKRLKLTLADVLDRRELAVEEDATVTSGTRITMHHLAEKFVAEATRYVNGVSVQVSKLHEELTFRAMGFPIKVSLNGMDLPRPFAQAALQGEMTDVGFVSIHGVHRGELGDTSFSVNSPFGRVQYFLQGLPIAYRDTITYVDPKSNVVHLDQQAFTAMLPDRAHLKDESASATRVADAIFDATHRFLITEKHQLSSEAFMDRWQRHIMSFHRNDSRNHKSLLNDIPLLPRSEFDHVNCVSYDGGECWSGRNLGEGYVTADDVLSAKVRIWCHEPASTTDGPQAAAILKVMQMEGIYTLSSAMDKGHWIYGAAPSCSDMLVTVTPGETVGRAFMPDVGDTSGCELVLVNDFTITVTSTTDPDFRLERWVEDNWIVVPAPGADWDVEDFDLHSDNVCYHTVADISPDHPIHVFSDFTDANDHYDEEWEDKARERFAGLLRGLRGLPLAKGIQDAIDARYPSVTEKQMDKLTLVKPVQVWNSYTGYPGEKMLRAIDMDNSLFGQIARSLGGSVSAEQLREAFMSVVQPGQLVGIDDERMEMLQAAGYRPVQSALKTWYAILPGHSKADFEAENHNYVGLFSSATEMLDEMVPDILAHTAEHHGIEQGALESLDFVSRYNLVREAHPLPTV